MIDPFVATHVKRFVELARKDCEIEEAEEDLFRLVNEAIREAHDQGIRLGPLVKALEKLAHDAEVPPPGATEEEDDAAPLRYAGRLRRAADMLRGPERDITPGAPLSHLKNSGRR